MAALLRDAIRPNLVQTCEPTPLWCKAVAKYASSADAAKRFVGTAMLAECGRPDDIELFDRRETNALSVFHYLAARRLGKPKPLFTARIGRAAWSGVTLVADVPGDIALVIEEMAPRVRARPAADWDVAELDRLKRTLIQELRATPGARLVTLAREAMPAGTIATGDVPALAAWQAVGPRETLTALGMATSGYAVTAAVAAQLAHPDRRVVAFTSPVGLAAAEPARAMAEALALPIIAVVLGSSGDDSAFAAEFARAFTASRPSVLGC